MKKCNTGLTRLCFYVNPSSDLETGNFFGQSPDFCDNCDLKQSQVVAMIYETRTKSYVAAELQKRANSANLLVLIFPRRC